jgi:hypothetical protein
VNWETIEAVERVFSLADARESSATFTRSSSLGNGIHHDIETVEYQMIGGVSLDGEGHTLGVLDEIQRGMF